MPLELKLEHHLDQAGPRALHGYGESLIKCGYQLHLGGARVRKAGLDAMFCQGINQRFRVIHGVVVLPLNGFLRRHSH